MAHPNEVLRLVRVQGEREGRSIDVPAVHVWHVHDGRLSELWVHPIDQYAVDEFWADEGLVRTSSSQWSMTAVQTPARVNVTCVTPLGEEVASTS